MAEQNKPEEEPSIEEILASIRQIISDDDAEPAPAAAEPAPEAKPAAVAPAPESASIPEPAPEPVFMPEPEEEEDDDILDLSESAEPEPMEVDLRDHVDEPGPIFAEQEPEPALDPDFTPPGRDPDATLPPMEDFTDEALFTRNVESMAYAAISELASKAAVERSGGLTIEDVVRDELRPMLREWLDRNLPPLIERLVQEELERVSKRVLGDMGE